MWYSFYLSLVPLFSLLAIAETEFHREARQLLAAKIASARANGLRLAHPRNTTELVFGPQLYEAPLPCIYPDLIIPQAYGVRLSRGHPINEHRAVIVNDIRPFIRDAIETQYLELMYWAKDVDDQLLMTIRSDPKVLLVTFSVYDDSTFE
jgi:hypothetical protein